MAEPQSEGGRGREFVGRVLARVRCEGLWLLAGLGTLASLNVAALAWGPGPAAAATRIAPGDVLLALLAVAAAVEVVGFRRSWSRALPPLAAFGLVAASAVSALVLMVRGWGELSGVFGGAAREVVQLIEIFVVGYGWTLWAARRRRDIDRALLALAAAVTVNVLLAVVQLGSGAHPFHVRGLFANRNVLGMFLAVTLPVLVAAASTDRERHSAIRVWMLLVAASGLAIMTSGGLFVAAALGVLVAGFAVGSRAGLSAVAAVAVIAVLLQPRALPGVREAQYRSLEIFPKDRRGRRGPSERTRRWAAALECLRENSSFGVGPGRYQDSIGPYYLHALGKGGGSRADVDAYDVSFDEPGSHSIYEVAAVEGGLVGLVALAWFLAAAIARSGKAAARGGAGLSAGALGAAVAVLVAGVFGSVLTRGVALPFVMVLALGARSAGLVPDARTD